MLKKAFLRLRKKDGIAPMKAVISMFLLLMVFAFLFEVLSIQTIAMNIRDKMDSAVISVATQNKYVVFEGLREGNTYVKDENVEGFVTVDAVEDELINTLGLDRDSSALVKNAEESAKPYYYRISEIKVEPLNYDSKDKDKTTAFRTTAKLEVPLSFLAGNIVMTINIDVTSKYADKL